MGKATIEQSGSTLQKTRLFDNIIECSFGIYLFALFNPHVTALHSIGVYLGFLTWVAKVVTQRSTSYQFLLSPLSKLWFFFILVTLCSVFQSTDLRLSLNSFRKEFLEMMLIALPAADVFRQQRRRSRLLLIMSFAALSVAAVSIFQYLIELIRLGRISDNIHVHRDYANSLIFFIPFVFAHTCITKNKWFGAALLTIQCLLLMATGARGAWFGLLAGMSLWLFFRFRLRAVLITLSGLGVLVVLGIFLMPQSLFVGKLEQGFDSSQRTNGTWRPSIEMMNERPFLGFGFGKDIFHNEFNKRVDDHPNWSFRKSVGPHSNYLAIGFAAGYIGLFSMLIFYSRFIFDGCRLLSNKLTDKDSMLLLATMGSFVALYMVRGIVEVVPWPPIGIHVGILLASQHSHERL